jgi:hypothetical protein
VCRTALIDRADHATFMPLATSVAAAEAGDQVMTKSDQSSTGTPGPVDRSAKTVVNVSPGLTEDELRKVSGGAFDTYMQFRDSTGTWISGR